ncbi:GGDEF domain-containing protein [Alteromonas sp. CYL-A6]|uniref:GGDEF domain-containing protein n=1 Tax=Alteromonas nitratireducens TaxID=3390813 RepID=UPI0034B1CEDE
MPARQNAVGGWLIVMMCRAVLWCLLLLAGCGADSALADSAARLSEADALRLNDHEQARQLLSDIDVSTLTPAQTDQFLYLKTYLSTFNGDLRATYDSYGNLLGQITTPQIRVRALMSRLNLSAFIGEWHAGFSMAGELNELLERGVDEQTEKTIYQTLVTFYSNAGQYSLARNIVQGLRPAVQDAPDFLCQLDVAALGAAFSENKAGLDATTIDQTIAVCEQAGSDFFVTYTRTYLFYTLVEQGAIEQAQALYQQLASDVDALNFLYLSISFNAYVSKFQLLSGQEQKARETALKTLQLDPSGDYMPSKITALEVLTEVATRQYNYREAFDYLKQLEQVRSELRDETIIKQLAYQQANFNLILKDSEIQLLDERNRALEAQSQLARERMQSSYVALSFIALIVMGLLVWGYRSQRSQRKMARLARTDSLTGIYNRGFFLERVRALLDKAQKEQRICSLLLFDLDHFKRVNDTYGHQVGDWVLERVVDTVAEQLDAGTVFGRMGGEEFAVFLYGQDRHHALALAETCRAAIQNVDTADSGHGFFVSASFGVSDTSQAGYLFRNLSSASDLALYQSKQSGRNRVYEFDGATDGDNEDGAGV